MDCLFCKITSGEIPSKTIYENEHVKAIMDINPTSNGHILIIPKKHVTDFTEMDNVTLGHINDAAKIVKDVKYYAYLMDAFLFIFCIIFGIKMSKFKKSEFNKYLKKHISNEN